MYGEKKFNDRLGSSPRTWGCFLLIWLTFFIFFVFPTHVGVFLYPVILCKPFSCLPHARGGVSTDFHAFFNILLSSPRTWGCFSEASRVAEP